MNLPDAVLETDSTDQHGFRRGYRAHFREASVETLIARYNSSTAYRGWVRARGLYLIALRESLIATGLDCSAFIDDTGMQLNTPIRLVGRPLLPDRSG